MTGANCHIEIFRNGPYFIARVKNGEGPSKEYKNPVFEDMLTELITDLSEDIQEF